MAKERSSDSELVARLTPLNKPHVPELFKQIIRNHQEQSVIIADIMSLGIAEAQESWRKLKALHKEMIEYRRGAENALKWNTDKGNPA